MSLFVQHEFAKTSSHNKYKEVTPSMIASMLTTNQLVFNYDHGVRFTEATTAADREAVFSFRLKCYQQYNHYLLKELDKYGADAYDEGARLFVASQGKQIVASIRIRPYPFESVQLLPEARLVKYLGRDWQTRYLEWTRLLVYPNIKIPNLIDSLLSYVAMHILNTTNYQYYFGYTTRIVRRRLASYQFGSKKEFFMIPSRGKQQYQLLKGNFMCDLQHIYINSSPAVVTSSIRGGGGWN